MKNKKRGRKIINHRIVKWTRESHPSVHDLQSRRVKACLIVDCKSFTLPRRGLQIMETRMEFPSPFRKLVIYSISPFPCIFGIFLSSVVKEYIKATDEMDNI